MREIPKQLLIKLSALALLGSSISCKSSVNQLSVPLPPQEKKLEFQYSTIYPVGKDPGGSGWFQIRANDYSRGNGADVLEGFRVMLQRNCRVLTPVPLTDLVYQGSATRNLLIQVLNPDCLSELN